MAENRWIILQIRENVSDYFEIENSIKEVFGDSEYFIPIHYQKMGSYDCFNTLFDGYAFVKDTPKSREALSCIPFSGALVGPLVSSNKVQTLEHSVIVDFRKQLQSFLRNHGIIEGNTVLVLDGMFESLKGEVISIDDEKKATVRFVRLSREFIAPIPLSSLRAT